MLIAGEDPDVIMLTEVIPKAQCSPVSMALLSIPNYVLYTSFDPSLSDLGRSGARGISIYVRDTLWSSLVPVPGVYSVEHLWVKIKLHRKDFLLLGCFYRSPAGDGDKNMVDFSVLSQQACHISGQGLVNRWQHFCLHMIWYSRTLWYDRT